MHSGGFYSEVQSGAFRLENGNTLITDANSSRFFEVSSNGNIVYDHTHGGSQMIARAQKYGYDYFQTYELGDANGDGNIDVLDVVATVNIILGFSDFNPAADINQDNIVNVLDVISIVNIILG